MMAGGDGRPLGSIVPGTATEFLSCEAEVQNQGSRCECDGLAKRHDPSLNVRTLMRKKRPS